MSLTQSELLRRIRPAHLETKAPPRQGSDAPEHPEQHGRPQKLPPNVIEVEGELISLLPEGVKAEPFLENLNFHVD